MEPSGGRLWLDRASQMEGGRVALSQNNELIQSAVKASACKLFL